MPLSDGEELARKLEAVHAWGDPGNHALAVRAAHKRLTHARDPARESERIGALFEAWVPEFDRRAQCGEMVPFVFRFLGELERYRSPPEPGAFAKRPASAAELEAERKRRKAELLERDSKAKAAGYAS